MMGRSRRKSKPHLLLRVVSRGLPLPVRMAVSSRVGLPLVLLAVPVLLLLTGIVTWNWDDGKPELSVDRERVEAVQERVHVVEERVAESVDSLKNRVRTRMAERASLRAPDGSFNPFWSEVETLGEQGLGSTARLEGIPEFDLRPGLGADQQSPARDSFFEANSRPASVQ